MKKELILVKLDSDYCNYLRKFDEKVPYNYNKKNIRPFVGVLFMVNNIKYFAPLSSPKPKHLKIKPKLDFMRIDDGKLGAINFNNMIPVKDNNIIKLDLNTKFSSKKEAQYLSLLNEQIYWLNRHVDKIYLKSKKLYDKYNNGTLDKNIKKRCCNFKLLEEKCSEYNKIGVNLV